MKKLFTLFLTAALTLTSCAGSSLTSQLTGNTSSNEFTFEIDEGFRIENATNPIAAIDENGGVYLWHEDKLGNAHGQTLAYAEDALNFEVIPSTPEKESYHPAILELADGTFRRYIARAQVSMTVKNEDPLIGTVFSKSSTDGVNFTEDEGLRYEGHESDNKSIGVNTFFTDSKGGVVMLYIGDMGNADNIRRAYAEDGMTFEFEGTDFIGDPDADILKTHVDPNTTQLSNGNYYLLTMVRGDHRAPIPGEARVGWIYGTMLDEDGYPIGEPQKLFDYSDFTEHEVWSLNDPVMVQLPDGRLRIYVAALMTDPEDPQEVMWTLVSATSTEAI